MSPACGCQHLSSDCFFFLAHGSIRLSQKNLKFAQCGKLTCGTYLLGPIPSDLETGTLTHQPGPRVGEVEDREGGGHTAPPQLNLLNKGQGQMKHAALGCRQNRPRGRWCSETVTQTCQEERLAWTLNSYRSESKWGSGTEWCDCSSLSLIFSTATQG